MVKAQLTSGQTPTQKQAAIADPKIDRLALEMAQRRRDLTPEKRRALAILLSRWARTYGLDG